MGCHSLACRRSNGKVFRPAAEDLTELLADEDVHLWVDVDDEGGPEEKLLTEVFGFHPLVVEDILDESHPKLEVHDEFLYLIVHGPAPERSEPQHLETVEVDVVIGDRFVLTHHDAPVRSIEALSKAIEQDPALLRRGAIFVAHAITDRLTDEWMPLMEGFDRVIDKLEAEILHGAGPDLLSRIFGLRHSLTRIRRISLHQTEILSKLSRGGVPRISEDAQPFFRDVYDHFVHISDLTSSYRELVVAALDAHLSMQSNRMNEIMKVLTLISTIMLPLTFITGLYGMNFDNMPELHWSFGYLFAWGAMILTAGAFLIFFKRRHWL